MKKIVILHIFHDEKFFDHVSDFFDSLKNVENLYYYYTPHKNTSFKYIRSSNKIKIIDNFSEYIQILSSHQIDIIYFQSLSPSFYHYFKYINPKTILIWWCFGYEIYNSQRYLPPMVKINLFKPLTFKFKYNNKKRPYIKNLIRSLYWLIRLPWDYYMRKKIISRIDYFSPVLPIEYELMKRNNYFKAQPFMINEGPGLLGNVEFTYFKKSQNVLIGNSFTYTNNHLDIFHKIKSYKLSNQKYIIPINYGTDYAGKRKFFKHISGLSPKESIWLDDFIPYEEYKLLLSSVSHAIFGHMRQQAMGNIYMCLLTGAKVFLYKDSLLYKQLKDFGYIVFSIENDLSEEALKIPLSKEDAYHNFSIKLKLSANKVENVEQELERIVNIK